jgi:hypothetical protein
MFEKAEKMLGVKKWEIWAGLILLIIAIFTILYGAHLVFKMAGL